MFRSVLVVDQRSCTKEQ